MTECHRSHLQTQQQDHKEGSGFWDGIRYSQGHQVPVTYQKQFVILQEKEIKFVSYLIHLVRMLYILII